MRNLSMKVSIFLLTVFFCGVPLAQAQPARVETIAAVVNEDAVSETDVKNRLRMVIASSGMPDSREIRERLTPQIVNMLIEEKLKLQEAARMEIDVTEAEIERGFATIAAQNNFTPEQFRSVLNKAGVAAKTLEDQIRSQIAWSKVVQMKLRPQVSVADNEIDAVINRIKANEGKDEYLVSEIFLPVEKPGDEANVRQLADKLMRQLLDSKVPFQRLAVQFSRAAGASKGGDIGWVQEGQLPPEIGDMLARMGKGDLSEPVRTLSGYHLLYLRDKRTVTAESLPSREQVMNDLGMARLDRLQRRYLMDLKTAAFIEHRA